MSSASTEAVCGSVANSFPSGSSNFALIRGLGAKVRDLMLSFWEEISAMEAVFIKLPNVYTFLCQLFFFVLCELALLGNLSDDGQLEKKPVTGLTTLLMYSVVAYFASKVKEVYTGSSPGRMSYGFREYTKWIAKIILEWIKAVVVIICLKEQGIKYKAEFCFTAVTFSYYICTEKVFRETIPEMVGCLKLEIFDSLEHLYVPIIMYCYTILAALLVSAALIPTPYTTFTLMASYIIVYIRTKDLLINYVSALLTEKRVYSSFKKATAEEIKDFEDVCAVCLNRMSRARITPCRHYFHPHCLKQCLQNSHQCPICKRSFVDEYSRPL